MGQFSNSYPKHFSSLCEYAFRFDLSCSFCEYLFIFHCLHCSPSCFDPDSLLLAHLWLGLSWIDCISTNNRFSSPKTSSRKPYTSSKQQERQKHSAETTINFSADSGEFLSVNHIPPLPIPNGLEYPRHGTKGDIKGRDSRLGVTRSPRFPTLEGRPRRPILPFGHLWTQLGSSPRLGPWRSLGAKYMGVFNGLPVDCMWNSRSDLQAGVEIYHWGYLQFWLILSSQNDPLLGPQLHPPVWSIDGPISLCP